MGAIANAGPYVEFSIEGPDYYPWQDGLFAPALVARDGKVAIPDGPGWGVEIDQGWLDRAVLPGEPGLTGGNDIVTNGVLCAPAHRRGR